MQEIKFEYELGGEDFSAASKLLAKKMRRRLWYMIAITVLLLVVLHLLPPANGTEAMAGLLLGVMLMNVCGLLTYRSQVEKAWKSIPCMKEGSSVTLTEDGVLQTALTSSTQYQWSHFQAFQEGKTHFFLMLGAHPGLWFPKRVIPEAQQELVRALLKGKIPQTAN
ncbi:MAG: hypothetical protein JWO13_574 [Acidobacteriales bacterium]|nr:hypothetical protein [Terriglobales bacterium]